MSENDKETKNETEGDVKELKRRPSLASKATLIRQKMREKMGKVDENEKSEFPELRPELDAAETFHEHLKKIKKCFSKISKTIEGNSLKISVC
jgi:hypothetical protein